MFKRTEVNIALAAVFGGALAVAAMPGMAQQAEQKLERVEITGSSVKRIAAEGALPVLVLSKGDIERTGATSTVDLLRNLPVVQGATGESASVGGGTFGFSGVSVHNLGENRTLVLLNGHRLTLFGGQTLTGFAAAFDLNSIPVSAIERVEILTDGASALYGSDAIAGVVNFITKRDVSIGDVSVGLSKPKGGADEKRFSISKGFGSLQADGYNIFATFAHDERTQLFSTDRNFSKTGQQFFNYQGQQYRIRQGSTRNIPANTTNDAGKLVSPYLIANGVCPDKSFRVTDAKGNDYCSFDFVTQLEIYPERKRDSFIASFTKTVESQELYADLLLSRTSQISRIAPVPGEVTILPGSDLHKKYLLPIGITKASTASYRVFDLGKRTDEDEAKFSDLALGSKGQVNGWDYNLGYTHSESKVRADISGYPGGIAFSRLLAGGKIDPFVGPGQQSAAGLAALNAVSFSGYWDGGKSVLDTVSLHGSKELATLPGGPLQLGAGVNMNRERFQSKPSLFAQGKLSNPVTGASCDPSIQFDPANPLDPATANACDTRFGDSAQTVPYSANRKSYGAFAELVVPLVSEFELSAAVRYDDYSDFGSALTAKESFRWTPTKDFLVRGSIGSGFHAPTVPQVNAARQPFGVTSDNYDCTPELQAQATRLGAQCRSGNVQYDQIAGGNPKLEPEKSFQASLGARFEPTQQLSLGADLWHVSVKDSFGQLPEQLVFANPAAFQNSWTTAVDPVTKTTYLAFLADNQNLGKLYSTGLDFDISGRNRTELGDLSSRLTLTYMIREVQQQLKDGEYFSAIGNYADLGAVTFRWQGKLVTSLKMANWVHTLGINFKSGFKDQAQNVTLLDASGKDVGTRSVRLDVYPYATGDWQTQWSPNKSLGLTVGVLNIFDAEPPLSIATSGANRGQQFGYDPRYYDPRGRTLYANLSYKF